MHLKRFGVSIEDSLLVELDRLAFKYQFPNRSQAIRYLIKKYSVEDNWDENREVAGAVVLLYDHHKKGLQAASTRFQHAYHHLILAVQHVHLDHDNCLETITLKGKAKELRDLADKLIAIKGVFHGELVMTLKN
jgi:CopG family transcriptional regulator, nickel-responsive regulator